MPRQQKNKRWRPAFETRAKTLLLKETAGSKTRKIAEPATDDNRARTTTHDHIHGGDILQNVYDKGLFW
jgi:hypothetical protein